MATLYKIHHLSQHEPIVTHLKKPRIQRSRWFIQLNLKPKTKLMQCTASRSPFTEKNSVDIYQREQWVSDAERQLPSSCGQRNDDDDDDIALQLPELKKLLEVLKDRREKHGGDEDQAYVGNVFLVGTGPGDPDLLTLKALKLIQSADLLLYDRLVSHDILELVGDNARLLYVGKTAGYHSRTQEEIHELLLSFAEAGANVVRLKGGDPLVFGRGGEEMDFLQQKGIQVKVVPGITAASGIAAELGIPLTHRGIANSVRYLTGHSRKGGTDPLFVVENAADPDSTLVVYMGLSTHPSLAQKLMQHGLPTNTPAVAVERGTTPEQRMVFAELKDLPEKIGQARLVSPTLLIIGKVVALSPLWMLSCEEVTKLLEVNGTTVCGVQYSTLKQAVSCPIPNPPKWPALLQVPAPEYRATQTDLITFPNLPNESCRRTGSCPVTILMTGKNQTLGQSLANNLYATSSSFDSADFLRTLAENVFGSASKPDGQNFLEPAYFSGLPLYVVRPTCPPGLTLSFPIEASSLTTQQEVTCVQGLHLWRNSSSVINDELYKGYWKGNLERKIEEIVAAYDFLDSNTNNFNVSIWYNATYKNDDDGTPGLIRVPRSIYLVSNAYLQFLLGPSAKMLLEFIKEMPKPGTQTTFDISSLLSTQFFTYVIIALFPVVLTALVYEKQQRLRIMMKMHGLGDGPYWTISYACFLAISMIYMICFVIFGSLIGLQIFTTNDYSIQFVFYFIYINLQIAVAFLVAPGFSNVLSARAVGYLLTFGTGLLGGFLFRFFIEDTTFPRIWLIVMELYPGFSLFRGLYELGQYSFVGSTMGTDGMQWKNLSDERNGMKEVLIIMVLEWLILLPLAFYIDKARSSGRGVINNPLLFLRNLRKKPVSSSRKPSFRRQGSKVFVEMEKADVVLERERVEQMILESSPNTAIICDNLRKVYLGRDGNPPKLAVKGISLAVSRGECFGMLGPNGAGKTSFISMMIGLTKPTSGKALVEGLDIGTQMGEIYTSMSVCPQHDLLWETLTGREHLLFYGRLKNLKGSALLQAVEDSLKSVNLYHGGVGDKFAGKYSGGMKRRLSVAISLIGDPKVVYMDEPSTGLDPASRNNLWNVLKQAKQGRAIILTTHSMEEAEVLCDRIGIFVDGGLQCIGNPKELKGRYGGSFVFTMTTAAEHDEEVERMAQQLSRNSQRIYHISGTQKFEIPKHEIRISDVFKAVEDAKKRFTVQAWGLADTTLEDVFIKVSREAQTSDVLS